MNRIFIDEEFFKNYPDEDKAIINEALDSIKKELRNNNIADAVEISKDVKLRNYPEFEYFTIMCLIKLEKYEAAYRRCKYPKKNSLGYDNFEPLKALKIQILSYMVNNNYYEFKKRMKKNFAKMDCSVIDNSNAKIISNYLTRIVTNDISLDEIMDNNNLFENEKIILKAAYLEKNNKNSLIHYLRTIKNSNFANNNRNAYNIIANNANNQKKLFDILSYTKILHTGLNHELYEELLKKPQNSIIVEEKKVEINNAVEKTEKEHKTLTNFKIESKEKERSFNSVKIKDEQHLKDLFPEDYKKGYIYIYKEYILKSNDKENINLFDKYVELADKSINDKKALELFKNIIYCLYDENKISGKFEEKKYTIHL